MAEEDITQEFRLKNIHETRDYFLEEKGLYKCKLY